MYLLGIFIYKKEGVTKIVSHLLILIG